LKKTARLELNAARQDAYMENLPQKGLELRVKKPFNIEKVIAHSEQLLEMEAGA
jgi:hypothetical protein